MDSTRSGKRGKKGNWVFQYIPDSRPRNDEIDAFYFLQTPSSEKIQDKYARLVLYGDCMTDTGTTVLFKNARNGDWRFEQRRRAGEIPAQIDFRTYLDAQTKNVHVKYHLRKPRGRYGFEDSLRHAYIRDSLSSREEFKALLAPAVEEALRVKNVTNLEFEYCTERYYSKSAALMMKRNRKVVGDCSMDDGPRVHAMNIALLAAETAD